jgi:putative PIG3 family NAD(P)H quinone oxidoreductase
MTIEKMHAVVFDKFGEPNVLYIGNVDKPIPGPGQILVKVHATALNRADTLQRRGKYPPPAGDSTIMGLEIAGLVAAVGKNVENFKLDDKVFGLVGGGGYAEYCLLDAQMAMKMPSNWDFTYAAAIPEVFLTANETAFELGQLQTGQDLLLHAAASGVGTTIIQMAKNSGANVYATVGSEEKATFVLQLGATAVANYKTTDFLPWIMQQTNQRGVDVVEDFVGKDNFTRNLAALKAEGRLIQVATMSGATTEIDLRTLMSKRLHLIGSVMRSRSLVDKRAITKRFIDRWWDKLIAGEIKPTIDKVYDWHDVIAAHERMESNANIGKIVLKIT